MRILRLDLLKFGPFTDVSLSVEAQPPALHVVCGPNEAGKSSALRALRQFFYGIPNQTADSFLHVNADLRIGALLESADGQQLYAIRRKATAHTLRAADDVAPLDPARLAAVLGGVDETTFRQRFGIDYEELVRGGAAIARGGGDLGAMLFAAGLGIADLNQIAKGLADEADLLFKPRGVNQRINRAVAELAAARRVIKESQLPESEWVTHDRSLQEKRQRAEEISAALLEKRTEHGRLQRLENALPVISRRTTLLRDLEQLAHIPLLPDDFSEHRREAVNGLHAARSAERESGSAIEKISAAVADLQAPPGLLDHAGAIQQLKEDLGIHRKAMKDRTGLVARRQQLEHDAQQILAELGHAGELADAPGLRIGRAERRRIQDLASQHVALSRECEAATNALRSLEQRRAANERQMQSVTETRDAGELSRAIRRAQQHHDLELRADRARRQLEAGREQLQIDLQQLTRWTGTLAALEVLKVPTNETIDRFATDFAKAEGERDRVDERIRELDDELSQLDQQIEQLRLQADVPTEADLQAARAARDDGWRLVLRDWQHQGVSPDESEAFLRRFPSCSGLASAFEASVQRADELADRLRREADQVAMQAKLIAERDKKRERLADQRSGRQMIDHRLEQLSARWHQQWQPLGIEADTPREMRVWREQHAALVAAAATLRSEENAYAELADQVRRLRDDLSHCLADLGEPCPRPDETLACLVERCEQLAAAIQAAHDQRQALARDQDRLRDESAEAEQTVAVIRDQLAGWEQEWAAAIERLRLSDDLGPAEANAILEAIQDLHGKLGEAARLRERIEGIDKDAEAFGGETRRLSELAAPDLAQLPAAQAANDLYDRLIKAQKAEARLGELRQQLHSEKGKRDEARQLITRWQTALEALCREARCGSPDQLAEAERASQRQKALNATANDLAEQLHRLAAGTPVDEFVEQALHLDADHLSSTLRQLEDEIHHLEQEQAEVREAIGREHNELQRMDGSSRAAEAQAQAEGLMAQIRNDAQHYVRLRLAATVLHQTTERYRQKNEGPVLASASRLFRDLTLGSFDALRADFDDSGGAVLVGVRPNGRVVGVAGMSDGTRDQLYLALRLASLETYLADQEPLPFIVDDILIMFDDDRAVAALQALAQLSARTQVIFFTHHEHLVRLAEINLEPGSYFVHRLNTAKGIEP